MILNNSQGGIGAIGAMAEDDRGTGIDLTPGSPLEERPPMPERPPTRDWEEELTAHAGFLEGVGLRLEAIEGAILQAQGQQNQFEALLPQYTHAINALNARVTAIGQQVARNMRLAALDAAVKSGGPGLTAPDIIRRAEMFLAWAEPPVAPGGSNSANHLDEERPPDTVSH